MKAMPQISVVIPSYNYAHFISDAIRSVLAQTFRDFEIIVVDDGSTDNTQGVVAQFGKQVRYIYQANQGPCAARNTGIKASQGQFVALLDADDVWLPKKLELQLPLLEAHSQVGLVYSGMYLFDSETSAIIGEHPISRCHEGHVLRQLYLDQFVPSPTPLIRREVFDRVGLFDETMIGPDDWDMWLRIAANYDFAFVAEPLAMYRIHASWGASKSPELYEREMLAFFERAAQKYPDELGNVRRLRLCTFEEHLGWRLVLRGQCAIGRCKLLSAIRWWPFRLRPYLLLALSFIAARTSPESYPQSRLAYMQGKHSLFNLRLQEARRQFLQAIRADPWSNPRAYAGLALSFGGKRLVHWIRGRRKADFYCSTPRPGQNVVFEQW